MIVEKEARKEVKEMEEQEEKRAKEKFDLTAT